MNKKPLLILTLVIGAVLVLAGCIAPVQPESQSASDVTEPAAASESSLTTEALANMTYMSEFGEDGTVTLENGEYSAPAAPGSASMNTVNLLPEYTVIGELNGEPAAVVVLVSSGGGSGTFFNLAVVVEQDGQPVNIATYHLGDRIKLNSVAIEDNQIIADMIAAGPDDPLCCPTHHYVNTYELQDDQIVEVDSQMLGTVSADTETSDAPPLEGTNWQLVSYVDADGVETAVLPEVDAIILFEDGSIQGNAGCNTFSGGYSIDGDQLSVGPMASTMMACPEPVMQQELGVQNALGQTATFDISDDELRLNDADGNILATFVATPEAALIGPVWTATGYNNGRGGFTSLVIDTEITAVFSEDGVLSGSASCNNYNASYTTEDGSIQIGPAMTTRMMCPEPEGVMEQEQEYLAALETAAVYSLDVDTLEIRTADGALVAAYRMTAPMDVDEADSSVEAENDVEELVGPVWQWQGSRYNNDTEVVPADPSQYTVQFMDDGTVAVQADCNSGTGSYTLADTSISIEVMAMTMAFCADDSLDQEFLRDLSGAAINFFQDGDLFIDIMMDAGTMQFSQ